MYINSECILSIDIKWSCGERKKKNENKFKNTITKEYDRSALFEVMFIKGILTYCFYVIGSVLVQSELAECEQVILQLFGANENGKLLLCTESLRYFTQAHRLTTTWFTIGSIARYGSMRIMKLTVHDQKILCFAIRGALKKKVVNLAKTLRNVLHGHYARFWTWIGSRNP